MENFEILTGAERVVYNASLRSTRVQWLVCMVLSIVVIDVISDGKVNNVFRFPHMLGQIIIFIATPLLCQKRGQDRLV